MLEGGDHISERAHTYTFTANTHMYVCIILKWGPPMNHQSYFLAFCACLLLCFLRPEYKHFLSDDSVSPIFCKSFNLGPPSPEAFLPFLSAFVPFVSDCKCFLFEIADSFLDVILVKSPLAMQVLLTLSHRLGFISPFHPPS